MTKPRTMRTSSIQVKVPDDYKFLDSEFKLIRYVVPKRLKETSDFRRIYADVRDLVSHPHLVFSHDEVDGDEVDAVYVLYPHDDKPKTITFSGVDDGGDMQPDPLDFGTLVDGCGFHVLIKLMMSAYFDKEDQDMFVGRNGKNYVFAKKWTRSRDKKEVRVCVELSLKGKSQGVWQEFRILNSAAKFVESSSPNRSAKRRFGGLYGLSLSSNGKAHHMRQLRRGEIDNYTEIVYEHEKWDKHPIQLNQHNLSRLRESRGFIVHKFQDEFLEYLDLLGFECDYVFRDFLPFDAEKINNQFSVRNLLKVFVLDERHSKEIPAEYYVELLRDLPDEVKKKGKERIVVSTFGETIDFILVDRSQLDKGTPTIILQDAYGTDYKKGGFLHEGEWGDPYQDIYDNPEFRLTPKQFFNVNPHTNNDEEETKPKNAEEYLSYPRIQLDDYELRLRVALAQLFLKMLVIKDVDIRGNLYGFEHDTETLFEAYGFIRKKTYTNKGNFTILLYIEDYQLRYANLESPRGKVLLKEKFGLNIKDISRKIDARHKRDFDETTDTSTQRSFDLIISKYGLVAEIENTNETILPDYDEIIARQREWYKDRPIAEFKLTEKYKDRDVSAEIFAEIQQYDKELSLIAYDGDDVLSWDTLKKKFKEQIEKAIKIGRLQKLYRDIGMFKKGRTKELKVGEGIWYSNDELVYFVGSANPERTKRPKAILVRKFFGLSENFDFDIELFMGTLAVKFIKHNEYTVVPYFFKLIDVYVENVLFWEEK